MNNIDNEIKKLINEYPDLWEKNNYKKGKLLSKIGKTGTHNYYIESGILKAFVYNEDTAKEVIIGFVSAEEFIIAASSEYLNIPLLLNLEVVNTAAIYSINNDNWNKLIETNKVSNELLMQYSLQILVKFIEQAKINSYPRARTRYEKSLENYPCLRQVKDEYVASFLGIDVRTINRIK